MSTTTTYTGSITICDITDGISPTLIYIDCSHAAAVCSKDGIYNPSVVTFSAKSQYENATTAYNGYFVVEVSYDGTNWVSGYTSSNAESSINYTIPLGVNINHNGTIHTNGETIIGEQGSIINDAFVISSSGVISTSSEQGYIIRTIRCSLYSDPQTTQLLDQQRVNIAFDGVDGFDGTDGYSVILTNDNYTFAGNTVNAIKSDDGSGFNVAECNVLGYIGNTQVPCTIGTITGEPTGMYTSITGDGTTTAKFKVTVNETMISQNGVLNIPVIINDHGTNISFNMKFTYTLKLNGLDNTGLGLKINYSDLTTISNGSGVYYGYDDATKRPSLDNSVTAWVLWNGEQVAIPKGRYINPANTMPQNQNIYSVFRLNNVADISSGGVFHDVTWNSLANTWSSNTYSGSTATSDSVAWVWDEAKDIILAVYVLPSSGAIMNVQLFTPPKKYSELVEVAKGMANEAAKVANHYIKVDSTGIIVANMTDDNNNEYTPSNIPTGKRNVFITADDVKIRDGQQQLASYGDIIKLGREGENSIQVTNNTFRGVKTVLSQTQLNRTKDIEVFNITVADNKVVEISDVARKQDGDGWVSCSLTPTHDFGEQATLKLYGIIMLEDGSCFTTGIVERPYDASDESGDIIGKIISATWLDEEFNRHSLDCSIDYSIDSTTNEFSAFDNNTDKVATAQLAIIYDSEEAYPYYRFGVHNNDDILYDEGNYSFDIGENNTVNGEYAMAHGLNNKVKGYCGYANGKSCSVNGMYANASGEYCVASGNYSNASGLGNVAINEAETVIGKYAPIGASDDLLIVGNGADDSNRSYAMRLRNDGHVEFSGAVGGGLTFSSKADMISKMSDLKNQTAYSFFAQPSWTSFAINTTSTANSFGTICKMNNEVWYVNFTSNEKVYMAKYNVTNDTLSTNQLAFVTL